MAKKDQLRKLRAGTVINLTAKAQESNLGNALLVVEAKLQAEFKVKFTHEANWPLKDIVARLKAVFPSVSFHHHFDNSSIRPDGGFLWLVDRNNTKYPVLISEVKNQGTNDRRATEGLAKQAKGNAIERLGKNVIGLRAALLNEAIFPFVCFGYGCDFDDDSSIRDRVTTIAMFGKLNETVLHNLGPEGVFNRGSFYFRTSEWTVDEMTKVLHDVARRSIQYYFSKYTERIFTITT